VCLSVSVLGTRVGVQKTAEPAWGLSRSCGSKEPYARPKYGRSGSRSSTKRGTSEGGHAPARYIRTYRGQMCLPRALGRRILSPPRAVTRRRCGLLPHYFGHLFNDAILVHYFPLHIFILVSAELAAVCS